MSINLDCNPVPSWRPAFLSADGLDQLTMKGIAHTAWTADLLA